MHIHSENHSATTQENTLSRKEGRVENSPQQDREGGLQTDFPVVGGILLSRHRKGELPKVEVKKSREGSSFQTGLGW